MVAKYSSGFPHDELNSAIHIFGNRPPNAENPDCIHFSTKSMNIFYWFHVFEYRLVVRGGYQLEKPKKNIWSHLFRLRLNFDIRLNLWNMYVFYSHFLAAKKLIFSEQCTIRFELAQQFHCILLRRQQRHWTTHVACSTGGARILEFQIEKIASLVSSHSNRFSAYQQDKL